MMDQKNEPTCSDRANLPAVMHALSPNIHRSASGIWPAARGARVVHLVVAVWILAYGAFVVSFSARYACGADCTGYFNLARVLSRGEIFEHIRPIPGVTLLGYPPSTFCPQDFAPAGNGRLQPTSPMVGWPLHLAAASLVVDRDSTSVLILTLFAMGTLLLFYLLCLAFSLPPSWAAATNIVLGIYPLVLQQYLWPMSEGAAMFWFVAAMYLAWSARRHPRWAVAAGIAAGIAILVRPPNFVLFPALVLALPSQRRSWLGFGLGSMPSFALLLVYNWLRFNDVLASPDGLGELLSPYWVVASLSAYGQWFGKMLGPGVLLLFLLGLALAWARDRRYIVMAAWVAGNVGFYAFYLHSHTGWAYLRFVTPAVPAVLLMAALVARDLIWLARVRWGLQGWRRSVSAILLLGVWGWAIVGSAHHVRAFDVVPHQNAPRTCRTAARWVKETVPENAVVLCHWMSGPLFLYTDLPIVRLRISRSHLMRLRAETTAAGTPVYAILRGSENRRLTKRFPGFWVPVDKSGAYQLWRLTPDEQTVSLPVAQ